MVLAGAGPPHAASAGATAAVRIARARKSRLFIAAILLPLRASVNSPHRRLPWHWGKLRARRGASALAARGVRGCTLRAARALATKYGEANCPSAAALDGPLARLHSGGY